MNIYTSDTEFIVIEPDADSARTRTLMGNHSLTIHFSLPEPIDIPVGSWCEFQGQRYELFDPQNFKKHHTRHFEYTLVMEAEQAQLKKFKFRDPSPTKRLKFSFTAKPVEHLKLLVENLNRHLRRPDEPRWEVGRCIEAAEKHISYNHTDCWSALSQQASAFETEWEVQGRTINLGKVEYNKDPEQVKPLQLSYGRGKGLLPGVGRANYSGTKPVEKLFVQGGTRNIYPPEYNDHTELLLPVDENGVGQELEYEGRRYKVVDAGLAIQRADRELMTQVEDSLDLSHIYPSRVGTVGQVDKEVNGNANFFDFYDSDIPDNLDYKACLIPGQSLSVIFQSGMLAGKEFGVRYKHTDNWGTKLRKFELVPQEIDGIMMPDSTFRPETGDTYAVFGMMMPAAYICDNDSQTGASWEMFHEAARYLCEHEDPQFSFTGELDGLWAAEQWDDIGGYFRIGGYVHFFDEQFQTEPIPIRITGIREQLHAPHRPTLELSNAPAPGSVSQALKKVDQTEVVIEESKKEAISFSQRRFHDTQQTMELLQQSLLNFSEGIRPVTVQTMQMLVGDESLQFRFVNSRENPQPVEYHIEYDNSLKVLRIPSGVLQHMTLGISSVSPEHSADEYKFWDMSAYESAPLDVPEQAYFIYAKVGKDEDTGTFHRNETAVAMDPGDGYYYFLVAILNSEFEGQRSVAPLYGFTEILPGRITTDRIVSGNGHSYLDLKSNEFRLGVSAEKSELYFNDGQLSISGNVTATSGEIGGFEIKQTALTSDTDGGTKSPNIRFNDDGSGHLAAGRINWGTDGAFQAGILDVPSQGDIVVVSGGPTGNIVITNGCIDEIATSPVSINKKREFHKVVQYEEGEYFNTDEELVRVEQRFSDRMGILGQYQPQIEVTVGYSAAGEPMGDQYHPKGIVEFDGYFEYTIGRVTTQESLDSIRFDSSSPSPRLLMSPTLPLIPFDNRKTYTFTPTIADVNDGDNLVMRVVATRIRLVAEAPFKTEQDYTHAQLQVSISVGGGVAQVRQTIIGSDGIMVQQDSNNAFIVRQESDGLGVYISGLPINLQGYAYKKGRLYRLPDGTLKVATMDTPDS